MVRGRMIVERAIEEELLDGNRRLLVVGAGAGGATAAIRAVELAIPTVLVEQNSHPFLTQGLCESRWVDPTQYDWPINHWAESRYHWRPPRIPLPWTANYANDLAERWRKGLHRAARKYRHRLVIKYFTTFHEIV
jgi:flavin-dependent dehydrogenase